MPVVTFKPKTPDIENCLANQIDQIRSRLKQVICEDFGFSRSDVHVNLENCTLRSPDPDAPDFVLLADTCPNEKFEKRADEFCLAIAHVLIELGLTDGEGAEVWPRILPGPWCLVKHGRIMLMVQQDEKEVEFPEG